MGQNSTDVVAGTNATALQYNNLRKDVVLGINNLGTESIVTTTATIDFSSTTKGKIRSLTLTVATTTLVFSSATIGQAIYLRLIQDGTGGRLVTWPTIIWQNGSAPTLSTLPNKIDVIVLVCTALNTYDGFVAGQNLA